MREHTGRCLIAICALLMTLQLLITGAGNGDPTEPSNVPSSTFAAPSSVNWIADLPGRVTALEVGPEGNAYFMDEYLVLRCADPGGNLLWSYEALKRSSLMMWEDRILLRSQEEIVCLGPNGSIDWRIEPPRSYFSDMVVGEGLLVELGSEGIAVYDGNGALLWDWYLENTVYEDENEYYGYKNSYVQGGIQNIWTDHHGRCLVHCNEYRDGNRTESFIIFDVSGQVSSRLDEWEGYLDLVVRDGVVFSLVWNEDDSLTVETLAGSELVEMAVLVGEYADVEILETLGEDTALIGNGFAPYYSDKEAWLMAFNRSDGTVLGEYRSDRFFEMETRDGRVLLYEYDGLFDEGSISFDRVVLDRNMKEISRIVAYPMYRELHDAGDHVLFLGDGGRVIKLDADGIIVNVSNSERIDGWDTRGLLIRSAGNMTLIGAYGLYSLTDDGVIEWSIDLKGEATNRPVQNIDGSILIASDSGELRCYSRTGEISWTFKANNSFKDPILFPNGTIALLSGDRELYCLDQNGGMLWNRTLHGGVSEVLIGPGEGRLLVLMKGDNLTTIGWGGVEEARTSLDWSRYLEIATSPEGNVMIGSDSSIRCLDPGLEERWSIDTGEQLDSGPVIGFDGTVYYDDGEVHAVSGDGERLWSLDRYTYRLVPGPDGILYSFRSNTIERILPNGSVDWEASPCLEFMDDLRAWELAFGDDGVIYCFGDGISAIGPNGTLLWKYLPPGWEKGGYVLRYAPVIDKDDGSSIYISTPKGLMSVALSTTHHLDPPKVVDLKENSNGGISWDLEEGSDGSVISGIRILKGKSPTDLSYYRTLDPSSTSYSDRVERRGNISFYSIQTFNSMTDEGPFGPVMTDNASLDRIPTQVNNVEIDVGDDWIRIYWDPPTDPGEYGLTGYRIYRANGSRDENFTLIAMLGPDVTSYTDTGLELYEWYYYQVASENEFGWRRNTSSWGGRPHEDFELPSLGGMCGAPIMLLAFVAVIAHFRMRRWKKSSEWVRSDDRPSSANARRGNVLYRHCHMLEDASGYAMLFGYGFGLLVAISMPMATLWSVTPSEFLEGIAGNPIYMALALIDVLYLTSVLWVPFLFFPTTMVLYTNGIDPGSGRFMRWIGRRPSFIPFRDISAIFPRFDPVIQSSRTELKGDKFQSFVIVMRNGKRCEVRWNPYNYTDPDDRLELFREFLSKVPKEFRERWSDTPLLTGKEAKLIEKVRKEKEERSKPQSSFKNVAAIAGIITLFMPIIVFMAPALLILKGEKDFGAFNAPIVVLGISGIALFMSIVIAMTIWQSRRKDIPGLMHQLERPFRLSGEKDHSSELKVPGLTFVDEGRPYDHEIMEKLFKLEHDRTEIDKAVRATLRYRKGAGPVAFTFLMIALFGVMGSLFVLLLIPWWISMVLLVVCSLAGAAAGLMEWRFKALSKDTHKTVIERTMIREVVEGRKILPMDYSPPEIVGYRRGRDPLKEREIRKIRWWGRFSSKAINRLTLGSIIGIFPMVIFVTIVSVSILGESTIIFVVIALELIAAAAMFAFGISVMSHYSTVMYWIDKYTMWERFTGIDVLPQDIRRMDEKRKSEEKKGSEKKMKGIPLMFDKIS